MAHVLLGRPVVLDQVSYAWMHNSILSQVEKFISQSIDSDVDIYCDAGGRPSTIPPDSVATSDKLDLVIVK